MRIRILKTDMKMSGLKKRIRKTAAFTAMTALIWGSLVFLRPEKVNADVATDYLSIRVGYLGCDLSDYVEVANFYWYDLMNMGYAEETYSYFNGTPSWTSPEGHDMYASYNLIVDTAHGIYLRDILDASGIYYGDIYNVLFWVNDHQDIWAAFDRDNLFSIRYYYEDMAENRHVYYNDGAIPYAYSFENASNYGYQVEPMMAFEDNWQVYNEEFENSWPSYDYFNTGNRFRLLFGQEYPTESETRRSAKYVSVIYVTIWGQPQYSDNPPSLDGSRGSHEVEMELKIDPNIIQPLDEATLEEIVNINSTDESVLQVRNVEIIKDSYYTDIAVVKIQYEIVGEGSASLTATFGSSLPFQNPVTGTTDSPMTVNTDDFKDPDPVTPEPDPVTPAPDPVTPAPDPVTPTPQAEPQDTNQNTPANSAGGAGSETNSSFSPGRADSAAADAREVQTSEQRAVVEETQKLESVQNSASVWKLSDKASSELSELLNMQTAFEGADLKKSPNKDINQLIMQDKSEEEAANKKVVLFWTSVICAVLAVLGAVTCYGSFRSALKRASFFDKCKKPVSGEDIRGDKHNDN